MLQDHKAIAAFRRNKNLGDLLVKAKISPLSEPKRRDQGNFSSTTSGWAVIPMVMFFYHCAKGLQDLKTVYI